MGNVCTESVNYSEAMVTDQTVVGCADVDIQKETLARDSKLESFKDKFDLIHAAEEGKCLVFPLMKAQFLRTKIA